MMKRFNIFLSLVLVFVAILSTEARANYTYGFGAISNNSGVSSTMAQQLSVEVENMDANHQVKFIFKNDISPYTGSLDGVITDVYFDDGTLLGISSVDNSYIGTLFAQPATPGNLPEGNTLTVPFVTTADFSADSSSPIIVNGAGPGEMVGIVFDLQATTRDGDGNATAWFNYSDVIAAINLGFNDPAELGSLRLGMRIQNLGDGNAYSDAFVMTPIPATILLGLLGLGMGGLKLRKSI
ncbi:MAG: hypothetical protein RQ760_09420 [Sedimentisphaerales bacterium]|nr:hypothetical protein [Sedimentisphaerales bacterium]